MTQQPTTFSTLIIEDDVDFGRLLQTLLVTDTAPNALPMQVPSLAEALEAVQHQQFDCIISDLELPDATKLEAPKALLAATPDTPLIVLTAIADKRMVSEALLMGAQDYLTKDKIDGDSLTRVIRYAVDRNATRQSLARAEQQIKDLLTTAPDAIFTSDALGKITSWNRAAERMFGYDSSEAIGMHVARLLPDDSPLLSSSLFRRHPDRNQANLLGRALNLDGLRKDGALFPGEVSISRWQQEDERAFTIIVRDVSERVSAQQLSARYASQLAALYEIDKGILRASEPEQIAAAAVSHLRKQLGCERVSVVQFDFEQQSQRVLALATNDTGIAADQTSSPLPNESFLARMHRNEFEYVRQALHGSTRSALRTQLTQAGVESIVNVPLMSQTRLLGTLNLGSKTPGAFSPADIELARQVASQVAIALQQASLLATTKANNVQLALLQKITEATLRSGTPAQMYQTLVDKVGETFAADGCYLTLWDMERKLVVPRAAYGPLREVYPDFDARLATQNALTTELLQSGHSRVINNWHDSQYNRHLTGEARPNHHTAVGLPLYDNQDRLGALFLAYDQARAFSPVILAKMEQVAEHVALSASHARALQNAEQRAAKLAALYEAAEALIAVRPLDQQLQRIVEIASIALPANRVTLFTLNHERAEVELMVFAGPGAHHVVAVEYDELMAGLTGWVVNNRQSTLSLGSETDPREAATVQSRRDATAAGSIIVCPLLIREQVLGTITAINDPDGHDFDGPDVDLLEAFASQAAAAIESKRLFSELWRANEELTSAYDNTLEGLAKALELRDQETEGHSRRVTDMACRLARRLGFEGEDIDIIRRGALLHDIGKMGVPDSILLKPGSLTAEERETMKLHTVYAREWLSAIPYLHKSLDIPYSHHERIDGSGYPQGLRDGDIPLTARMFAVIDIYDALCSDRPYRKAWPEADARAYIRREAGVTLDPEVVAPFLAMLDED